MNIKIILCVVLPLWLPLILIWLLSLSKQKVFDSFFGYYNLWLIWTLQDLVSSFALVSIYVASCVSVLIFCQAKMKEGERLIVSYKPIYFLSVPALVVGVIFNMPSLMLLSVNFLTCAFALLVVDNVYDNLKQKI